MKLYFFTPPIKSIMLSGNEIEFKESAVPVFPSGIHAINVLI